MVRGGGEEEREGGREGGEREEREGREGGREGREEREGEREGRDFFFTVTSVLFVLCFFFRIFK